MVRYPRKIEHHFRFWKEDQGFFTCETGELEAAIRAGGLSDEVIRRRMGQGYHLLLRAIQGARLNQYEVQHIEFGILGPARKDSAGGLLDSLSNR